MGAKLFVREWRESRGLGVRELARMAGISHRTIIDWERAKGRPQRIALETLEKLSDALRVEVWQLWRKPS